MILTSSLSALPLMLAAEKDEGIGLMVFLIILGLVLLVLFALVLRYLNLWIQCILTGAGIGLFQMFAMQLRLVHFF